MADTESLLTARLPRKLRGLGIPFAALALTLFFIVIGFPYHHLTNQAAASVGESLGVEIEAADSGFTVGLNGPGFRFNDIDLATPTGDTYALDTLRFGPAWSLSWFMLEPTLFFEIESPLGNAEGKVSPSDNPSIDATIQNAILTDIAFLEHTLPFKLTGTMSAEASIKTVNDHYDGPFSFDLTDGNLSTEVLPAEIAYDTVHAEVVLGGDYYAEIAAFELLGPMFNANIKGHITNGVTAADRSINFDLTFNDILPPLQPTIEALGAKVDPDGTAKIHIGGTLEAPVIR
jgi:type II secretion system protein N